MAAKRHSARSYIAAVAIVLIVGFGGAYVVISGENYNKAHQGEYEKNFTDSFGRYMYAVSVGAPKYRICQQLDTTLEWAMRAGKHDAWSQLHDEKQLHECN